MGSPEWLWPFFRLLRLTRQEALDLGMVDESWSGSHVVPQFKALPMGWSWSVYFCQAARELIVMQTGVVAAEEHLVDFGPALALSKDRCVWLGYIDNLFVASLDPETTEKASLAIDDQFRRRKLRVHEITEVSTLEACLGVEVDGKQGVLRLSQARVWKLYQAVLFLLDSPFLTSRSLSVTLGHLTFVWCLDRRLLTIPHSCYQFISKGFQYSAEVVGVLSCASSVGPETPCSLCVPIFVRGSLRV